MVATVYELRFRGDPFALVHWSFERPTADAELSVGWPRGRQGYPALPPVPQVVALPPAARLVQRSLSGVVVQAEVNGKAVQLEAGEVLALARLGLCGFRLVGTDGAVNRETSPGAPAEQLNPPEPLAGASPA